MARSCSSRFVLTSVLDILATTGLLWFVNHAGGDTRFLYNDERLLIVVVVICVTLLAFHRDEILAAPAAIAVVFRGPARRDRGVADLPEGVVLAHLNRSPSITRKTMATYPVDMHGEVVHGR